MMKKRSRDCILLIPLIIDYGNCRVATVLALIRGPVLRSFGSKRLRTGPGPVLEFTIVHLKNPINWHHTVLFCQP